jgi:hypothetical protein
MRYAVVDQDVTGSQCDLVAALDEKATLALEYDHDIDAVGVMHDAVVDITKLGADRVRVQSAEGRT